MPICGGSSMRSLSQHDVDWHWVKGHADTPGNHRADELANRGVDSC